MLPDADEAIMTMRDLASPVGAFVRERCVIGGDKQVEVDTLYAAYRKWCEANEHPKPTKQIFGRDLRAAFPEIGMKRPRVQQPGDDSDEVERVRFYIGIRLRKE